MIKKGIKVKIYPNKEQRQRLDQWFGCQRFVWNKTFNMLNERYKNNPNLPFVGSYNLMRLLIPLKNEYTFLKDCDATSLQNVVNNLGDAFLKFFEKKRGYPRFKSRKFSRQSFTIKNNNDSLRFGDSGIRLNKLGYVKARWDQTIPYDRIMRATVSKDRSDHYFVSVLVQCENQALDKTDAKIGIDLGQTHLGILSDGVKIPTKEYRVYEYKLKQWQRKQARRRRLALAKGVPLEEAKNYQEACRMVAKWSKKIKNCREDYLHKITKWLVTHYDFIAIENLNVKGLMSNPNNKRALKANNRKKAHQAWATFRRFLEYKADWYGKTVVAVDPAYTSQDCSNCSHRFGKLELSIREWTCPACHAHHDRDINAAQNILNKALGQELAMVK